MYLLNRCMDIKMLSTQNIHLDLIRVLLLPFFLFRNLQHRFDQFVHFYALSFLIPIIIQMRAVVFSLLLREQNGGAKKVLNP